MFKRVVLFFIGVFLLCSCANGTRTGGNIGNDTIQFIDLEASELGIQKHSRFIIRDQINLDGKNLILPNSVTLVFQGGHLSNGKVTGNNTKIETNGNVIFNNVRIGGTWIVPKIRTSMFSDLKPSNSLRNVIALANPLVKNTIYVEKGDYLLTANKNREVCLPLCSNTTLIIEGTIRLTANSFPRYDIIRAKGKNIVITGSGSVVGDKKEHTGTDGEWGMGIRIHNAKNVCVEGLTIRNCWGDCVYVGGNSKNVIIRDCILDNGRRQGISITKADSVVVRKCMISNVFGTKPEYAIDLEPNQGDTIGYVLIDSVDINNCVGGILTTKGNKNKRGKNAHINKIEVKNCTIDGTILFPIRIRRCDYATVEGCTITSSNSNSSIFTTEIGEVKINDNSISFSMNAVNDIDKRKYKSINVSDCGRKIISNNKTVNNQ